MAGPRGFLRDYTAGLSRAEIRRLFDRDAAEAYAVLTRDQPGETEPKGAVRRLFHRLRRLFLGVSYKLSPPRRALFAAGVAFALLGLGDCRFVAGDTTLDLSGPWHHLSIACLLFLLALELVDRVRVRDELEVARAVQRDLLPGAAPAVPGYAFAHSFETANEVGGDYYDFIPLPDGRLALAVADASGHGMAAGLLMAIASATLHTAVELDPRPEAVARLANRALARIGGRRAFLSLFYAVLDPATGALDYVCAGHPFPLLRGPGGVVVELGRGGLPLGLRPDLAPPVAATVLAPGALLAVYTDGLVEALDGEGRAFGFDRLARLVTEGGGAAAVHARARTAFAAHVGGEALRDDLSLVVVERLATC
jgi:hypothetical protein